MANKLLVALPVLALLVGVVVQQMWWGGGAAAPVEVTASTGGAAAVAVQAPEPSTPVDRREASPTGDLTQTTTPPFDPSPVSVPPWHPQILVVDEQDRPVADATITIWAAKKVPADPRDPMTGHRDHRYSYSGRMGEPVCVVLTDADGRAAPRLEVECLLAAASKEGLGNTADEWLSHDYAAARVTKFFLRAPITLRGVVLRPDGLPASGARVLARGSSTRFADDKDPPDPSPAIAGEDGRFTMQVCDLADYTLRAELGGDQTFEELVKVRDRQGPEVVLLFPGAISIAGLVVDPEGKPVAGATVTVWREILLDGRRLDRGDFEEHDAETDVSGRFAFAVKRPTCYQLIAHGKGFANSKVERVETTLVRPHAVVHLGLLQPASIQGRVVHADGSPFAGARVGAAAEAATPLPLLEPRDLPFDRVLPVISGEDGSFTLTVHPETTWTVRATAGAAGLGSQLTGIAPGAADVELRLADRDIAGCVVRGTVVDGDDLPVGAYRIDVVTQPGPRGMPGTERQASPKIDGAQFTVGPFALGRQFSLRLTPVVHEPGRVENVSPWAPVQVGPFLTDQAQLELEFRLEPWGELPVRVLGADGLPAKRLLVTAARDVYVGSFTRPQKVDAEGRAVLTRAAPGMHRLLGVPESESVDAQPAYVFDQPLRIRPGRNAEVIIHLPATK